MSRALTLSALQAVNAQETDEVFLVLLTLAHDSLIQPVRVTSDAVDTLSRGESFIAYPFDLSLPEDSEALTATAHLSIDNVDRVIIAALRGLQDSPAVTVEIVRAAAPDTVEAVFPDFRLSEIQYDAATVTGTLTIEDFTAEPYPAVVFAPAGFPGLF